MTTQFLPLLHGVRSQLEGYQRVAWFVFESFEREHLITLHAMSATLPTIGIEWACALQSLALDFVPARPAEAPSASPGGRKGLA